MLRSVVLWAPASDNDWCSVDNYMGKHQVGTDSDPVQYGGLHGDSPEVARYGTVQPTLETVSMAVCTVPVHYEV